MNAKPFLPRASRPAARPIFRAASAAARAAVSNGYARDVAKAAWPDDTVTPLILRAASGAASTTGSGWADALAQDLMGDLIASLGPLSAAARLIGAGVQASLSGVNSVSFPRRQGAKPASDIAWIAQGAPIPAKSYVLDSVTLGPLCKLPIMSAMTRELAEGGAGEAAIGQLLKEDVALTLDAALFSDTAGDDTTPSGILNGLTPVTASTDTALDAAMLADLENLAGAISDAGGSGEVVYVASPRQASAVKLRLASWSGVVCWPCGALANGVVVAIQPDAFLSGFGPVPRISASREATIHLEDTSPAQIGTEGTPPVVAAPAVSAFQQDLVVVRCILDAAWTMRQAGFVSYLTGAAWGGAAA